MSRFNEECDMRAVTARVIWRLLLDALTRRRLGDAAVLMMSAGMMSRHSTTGNHLSEMLRGNVRGDEPEELYGIDIMVLRTNGNANFTPSHSYDNATGNPLPLSVALFLECYYIAIMPAGQYHEHSVLKRDLLAQDDLVNQDANSLTLPGYLHSMPRDITHVSDNDTRNDHTPQSTMLSLGIKGRLRVSTFKWGTRVPRVAVTQIHASTRKSTLQRANPRFNAHIHPSTWMCATTATCTGGPPPALAKKITGGCKHVQCIEVHTEADTQMRSHVHLDMQKHRGTCKSPPPRASHNAREILLRAGLSLLPTHNAPGHYLLGPFQAVRAHIMNDDDDSTPKSTRRRLCAPVHQTPAGVTPRRPLFKPHCSHPCFKPQPVEGSPYKSKHLMKVTTP
ncbi:hypothetical protein JKP88DRAFT_252432 [Tribonema minus]|uniref:Uncharacterized protein n=1 Tax=Tribonema minus TaxID=303371 RepID=A0A835ZJJ1_9STRA|nr:hypothetical protein JKP88DRAFT_252432 [Tribonema minus]